MAVNEVIQLGAVNITLHPHPDGAYIKLFQAARKKKIAAKIFSDRYGCIGAFHPDDGMPKGMAIQGVISTFTHLDQNLPWFNRDTSDEATPEDIDDINLPGNIEPNHEKCDFYFDASSHTLIFNSETRKGGITPRQMKGFLLNLFSNPDLSSEFGSPSIHVVPDADKLAAIIKWRRMTSIFIHAERPNPGDYDEDDLQAFSDDLGGQNAKDIEVKLRAADDGFLSLSDRIKTIAAIGADNGYVEARGRDEAGNAETKSTKNGKPLVERNVFDSDVETAWNAFRRFAREVAQQITGRRRRK